MKQLILLLSLAFCVQDLSAQSSTESARRRKRLSKHSALAHRPNAIDTFPSRNGIIKARTMSKEEEMVRGQGKMNATQVNQGLNENMPRLSPSTGSGR